MYLVVDWKINDWVENHEDMKGNLINVTAGEYTATF